MKKHKINIITLGCSKNLFDSEQLATQLNANNFDIVFDSNDNDARTVILNTCGFIKDAKEESIDAILRYAKHRENGKIENLHVIGCLSERYKQDLANELPEVDSFFGTNNLQEIVEGLNVDYRKELLGERLISTPRHYAYLKISEGCDRTCSFCAIPLIKGKHRSVELENLVNQTKYLAERGVKEIILIAQDLSSYGTDLYKKNKLADLLKELVKIDKLEWIRLHYAYPSGFSDEVVHLMAREEKICNYLDIPLQHINDNVLKLMRRGHRKQKTLSLIDKLRKANPNISIRTTFLVGHPGEDEEAFNELKDFVKQAKFDRLGVFTYSEEEDTYGASAYEDKISEDVKNERADEIMAIQQQISMQLNTKKIGINLKVIIDRIEGDYYVGRSEYDSPEVDNEILIETATANLKIGDFYLVKIESATEYDLYGKLITK